MKKMLLALALCAVPLSVFAQQATPAAEKPPEGLNAADVQTLKDAVTSLQDSFGQQASGQQPVTQGSPAPTKKTMAEVADKVVDLGARAIAQAAGTVQKVAPEVWRIMIRQQYAKAAGLLTVPGGMFLVSLFFWFKVRAFRTRADDQEIWDGMSSDSAAFHVVMGYVAPIALMMSFGLWFLNRLSDSIMYLFNPEYYAFRDLLVMILNKGQGI